MSIALRSAIGVLRPVISMPIDPVRRAYLSWASLRLLPAIVSPVGTPSTTGTPTQLTGDAAKAMPGILKPVIGVTGTGQVGVSAVGSAASSGGTTPPPPPPTTNTALWQSVPYNPQTIQYFDSRPVATFVGSPSGRLPSASKHTRCAYATTGPTAGRLYFGGGDWSVESTGLADDHGVNENAQAAWCSMDPLVPGTMKIEQHRWLLNQSLMQPMGADEGAAWWDSTRNVLGVSALYSAGVWMAPNSTPLPQPLFVSASSFKMTGDVSASFFVGQQFFLYLNHPDFPTFNSSTIGNWNNFPCRLQSRVTAISVAGGFTTITFTQRPDYAGVHRLTFDRDALAVGVMPQAEQWGQAWLDNAHVYYDETTKFFYYGVCEWNPTSRVWTRRNFKVGVRHGQGVEGFALPHLNTASMQNGTFVPASVTGRGDEIVYLDNSGPDFGWWGAYVFDYTNALVDMYIMPIANRPATRHNTASITKDQPAFDPVGKAIYQYAASEQRIYKYDCVTRTLSVLIDNIPEAPSPAVPGNGHCAWNAELGMLEVFADHNVAGEGQPTLILVDPASATYHVLGNTLYPTTERIRGDEWYDAGDRTLGVGGEIDLNGNDPTAPNYQGSPPNQHIFIGKALTFQKLALAPIQQVLPIWGDPASTDAATVRTSVSPPLRSWGAPVVDPATGRMFWSNGGHGEYQGMDVHWCDLSQLPSDGTMTWTQLIGPNFFNTFRGRPHVPPATDNVYGNISSAFIQSDGTYWQHVSDHSYTQNVVHPTLGLIRPNKVPAGLLVPASGTNLNGVDGISSWSPTQNNGGNVAQALLTGFGEISGGLRAFLGDWDGSKFAVFGGAGSGDRFYYGDWVPGQTAITNKGTFLGAALSFAKPGGFNYWWTWLTGSLYLFCQGPWGSPTAGQRAPKMGIWDHVAHTFTDITAAPFVALWGEAIYNAANDTWGGTTSFEGVYMGIDRVSGRLWWLRSLGTTPDGGNTWIYTGPTFLYYSTVADPANIRPAPFINNSGFQPNPKAIAGSSHRGLSCYNGYAYIAQGDVNVSLGAPHCVLTNFYRIPIW